MLPKTIVQVERNEFHQGISKQGENYINSFVQVKLWTCSIPGKPATYVFCQA